MTSAGTDHRGQRLQPKPIAYGRGEVMAMRLFFALLFFFNLPVNSKLLQQQDPAPKPNGLAEWGIDFSWAADAGTMAVLKWILVPLLVLYVLGRMRWLALPYMLVMSLAVATLKNSQGSISHVYQVITMVVLAQTCWHVYVALRAAIGRPRSFADGWGEEGIEVFVSQSALAAIYLTTGVTKLLRSEGGWVWQLQHIGVDLDKTWSQAYYNELVDQGPGWAVAIKDFVTAHPWAAIVLFGPGILAELFAFLGLYGRRLALLAGGLLVVLHLGAIYIMKLVFWQNIACLLIYFVNLPYWICLRRMRPKR